MPPFVTSRKLKKNSKPAKDFNYEVSILVMAKQTGLSFEELNMMTLQEFVDYVDMWVGDEDNNEPRMATQEDIDNFYRYM